MRKAMFADTVFREAISKSNRRACERLPLPGGGMSETSVNAVLVLVEGAAPRNELEGALMIQMACAHAITVTVADRRGAGGAADAAD